MFWIPGQDLVYSRSHHRKSACHQLLASRYTVWTALPSNSRFLSKMSFRREQKQLSTHLLISVEIPVLATLLCIWLLTLHFDGFKAHYRQTWRGKNTEQRLGLFLRQAMEREGVRQTELCVHTMLPEKPSTGSTSPVKYTSTGLPLSNPASRMPGPHSVLTPVSINEKANYTCELGLTNVFKVLRQ